MRITVRRSAHFVLAVLLAGCTGAGIPVPSPALTTAPRATQTVPLTSSPTASLVPAPTPSATLPVRTGPCSPLAVLGLEQIPQYITQPFIAPRPGHEAEHPTWVQEDDGHHGLDIGYYQVDGKLFTGTPVLAALDGRVAAVIRDRPPYGNMVMLETPFDGIPPALRTGQHISAGDSLYTVYAHLQNLQNLRIGQSVTCGQPLAETGLTGFTGGPHLHFETRWGPPARVFDGMAYYTADATAAEMANYEAWRVGPDFHLFDPLELLNLTP